ncbi:unnamed protein product, partial [Brenthis ino]
MQDRFIFSTLKKTKYILRLRQFSTKVPKTPIITLEKKETERTKVDTNTIALLERLSLVKCDTDEGVKVLEDSIAFADKILHIDTSNVEPLYTVLENQNLNLREDKITQGNCQKDILKNATLTEDDYFVAPPGNIPLHEVQNKNVEPTKNNVPYYGFIERHSTESIKEISIGPNDDKFYPQNTLHLKLKIILPQTEIMQCFIQWQRYRKYWWSSVTTTPSLFSINDMKHDTDSSNVNIIANFAWGQYIVETINVNHNHVDEISNSNNNGSACLTCTTGLETAFLTLLLDGLSNTTKEEYLRLHNKMAPYKISFALDSEDPNVSNTLKELSTLLFHKLNSKKISAWLPSFTLPLQVQIKENLHLGVTYTAILSEDTLTNGIFHLLNSSTMLKEQLHVADFDSYAALLCGK